MTTTYDPRHAGYFDEADVRDEMTRVFGVCQECRRCSDLCGAFPTLFEMLDRFDDRDAGRLTPDEQDQVADRCSQCKLCAVDCPYTPARDDAAIDFPRLVLRAQAMRRATGQTSIRRRLATQATARPDLLGWIASRPLANRVFNAPEGSMSRRVLAVVAGISPVRLLPRYARRRFSTWLARRTSEHPGRRRGAVTVFPTCHVEYQATDIGEDLVRVYERNGIECSPTGARCCGAPWLHAGAVARFTKVAEKNVRILGGEVRRGRDVVVAQPACAYVLRHDYPSYVGERAQADAVLVAERTYDAAEYLVNLHRSGGPGLDTDFAGEIPARVTHRVASHLYAQHVDGAGRELMQLTGTEVTVVGQRTGDDGTWGLRAGNEDVALPLAQRLGEQVVAAGGGQPGTVVTGDSHLANTAITEQTGIVPLHPVQLIARAYALPVHVVSDTT